MYPIKNKLSLTKSILIIKNLDKAIDKVLYKYKSLFFKLKDTKPGKNNNEKLLLKASILHKTQGSTLR